MIDIILSQKELTNDEIYNLKKLYSTKNTISNRNKKKFIKNTLNKLTNILPKQYKPINLEPVLMIDLPIIETN